MPNLLHTRFESLRERNGCDAAWSQVVVQDSRNTATIISQLPGTVSDERTPSRDEWWVVLAGEAVMRNARRRPRHV